MFRKLATAVAATATAMLLAVSAGAAHADNYAGVGSDTTQDVMKTLTNQYKLTHPANTWTSVNAGATSGSIPAAGTCPGVTWTAANPAPNGSSAGITALLNDTNGCIDYARSSRALKTNPGSPELALTAVRLGGDSVTWSAASGGSAPSDLSLTQLRDIYKCNITNWNTVGGANAAIVRYVPQAGSGTRDFFFNTVLGFDPTVLSNGNCTTAPKVIQENKGDQVAAADKNSAIFPYSKASWTAQANSSVTLVTDDRGGFVLGTIGGTAAGSAGFIGNRDVYNVYKTASAPQDLIDFLNWAATQNTVKATYGFTA